MTLELCVMCSGLGHIDVADPEGDVRIECPYCMGVRYVSKQDIEPEFIERPIKKEE